MNPARQSSRLAGIKARCAQVLLCMLCSPAPHNTSLSFTLEESVHSRQEAAGGGVLPIRSMFAHACARVPPVWPRACLGLAWVHQTGAPPHKPYACLQSCMLQAQSRVAAIYDQLRMQATGLTGSQFASVWLNPDSQGIVGGSACVPLQICMWSYLDSHVQMLGIPLEYFICP